MSISRVINHMQRVLSQCGDPVFFQPTGQTAMADPGNLTVEINKVLLKRQNNCFILPIPYPACRENPDDGYWVNRIRISTSMIDDYSENHSYTDDELRGIISKKANLFGCF